MLINPSALLGTGAAPEPTIAPPSPQPGADFASLLRQQVQAPSPPSPAAPLPASPPAATATQAPSPAPAPTAAVPAPTPESQGADAPAPAPAMDAPNQATGTSSASAAASRDAAKAKPSTAPAGPAPKTSAAKAGADAAKSAAKSAADSDTNAATSANGVDPNLAQWLAQLHQTQTPEVARGTSSVDGDALAGGAKAVGGKDGSDAKAADALGLATTDNALAANAGADPGVAESALAELQATARSAESDRRGKVGSVDAASAAMSLAAPSTTSTASTPSASEPTAVSIPTPVDSPEFPQVLGVHLSVLAKDGVQQAELHLNPADMGPVSVQIAVDGTQARIDFGADVAATRHAIEAGLPELAGALRDAGLTLTGGGVSQQARGQGGDSGSGSRGNGRSGGGTSSVGAADASTSTARRQVAVGGLDLYA